MRRVGQDEVVKSRVAEAMESSGRFLDLAQLRITVLPPPPPLTALECLFLEGNMIEILPDDIFDKLPSLTYLDLRNNQLAEVPPTIGEHRHLHTLLLAGNALETLPLELGEVATLSALSLSDNPLHSPPAEVVGSGVDAVLEWLRLQRPVSASLTPEPAAEDVLDLDMPSVTVPTSGADTYPADALAAATATTADSLASPPPHLDQMHGFDADSAIRLPSVGDVDLDEDVTSPAAAAAASPVGEDVAQAHRVGTPAVPAVDASATVTAAAAPSPDHPVGVFADAAAALDPSVASLKGLDGLDGERKGGLDSASSTGRNYTSPDHSDLFGHDAPGPVLPLTPAQVKAARAASARNRAEIERKIRAASAKKRNPRGASAR
mmetsp:Transcript_160/g.529  ORF Transcript_160/g.529 Transcript_160/m.529 type:complete len:378 (-) Transcript_160:256-1389(-)